MQSWFHKQVDSIIRGRFLLVVVTYFGWAVGNSLNKGNKHRANI